MLVGHTVGPLGGPTVNPSLWNFIYKMGVNSTHFAGGRGCDYRSPMLSPTPSFWNLCLMAVYTLVSSA